MGIIKFDGKEFKIRALKRKEVKILRKKGMNLTALTGETAEDAMDAVFEMVFNKTSLSEIDNLPNYQALKLWQSILAATYGSEEEEKN